MTYEYKTLPKVKLKQVTTPNGRYYLDEDGGKYMSVTTVIDKRSDKTSLEEWKKRVGEKEAAKVSNNATRRGTMLHNLVESYLLSKTVTVPDEELRISFTNIKRVLEENVHTIYGVEHQMCSKK